MSDGIKSATHEAIDGLLSIDRLVHEPARLAILTVLDSAELVEFTFLQMVCRLSKGNLSSHLSKLEAGGLVGIDKSFRGRKPLTRVAITDAGRTALDSYRKQIAALVRAVPTPPRENRDVSTDDHADAIGITLGKPRNRGGAAGATG